MLDFNKLLPDLIDLSSKASNTIMDIYNSDFSHENKDDGSPLTLADESSNKIIIDGLKEITPQIQVISEENFKNDISYEDSYWLIDPLDGTKEFINRNGEFTVNIALIKDGAPILGIVFSPAVDENFYGAKNLGAFKLNGTERINIYPTRQNEDECRITLSKSHKSEDDEWLINRCKERFKSVYEIPTGSSLKLCKVAEGNADIYSRLGPTYQWDIAAGQAVVESAGGIVNDLFGNPLHYKFNPELKNPHFYCAGDSEFPWKEFLNKD